MSKNKNRNTPTPPPPRDNRPAMQSGGNVASGNSPAPSAPTMQEQNPEKLRQKLREAEESAQTRAIELDELQKKQTTLVEATEQKQKALLSKLQTLEQEKQNLSAQVEGLTDSGRTQRDALEKAQVTHKQELADLQKLVKQHEASLQRTKRPGDLEAEISRLESEKQKLESILSGLQASLQGAQTEWQSLLEQRQKLPEEQNALASLKRQLDAQEMELKRRQADQAQREKELLKQQEALLTSQTSVRQEQNRQLEHKASLDQQALTQKLREQTLKHEESEQGKQRKQLQDKEAETHTRLSEWEARLCAQEQDIKLRELNAEVGFAEQQRQALAQLQEEAEALHTHLSDAREKLAQARADWSTELDAHRQTLSTERTQWEDRRQAAEDHLEQQRQTAKTEMLRYREEQEQQLNEWLTVRRAQAEQEAQHRLEQGQKTLELAWQEHRQAQSQLAQERKNLDKLRLDFRVEKELFEEETELFETRVKQKSAYDLELRQQELQAVSAQRDASRERNQQLQTTLDKREEADRRFGHRSPDQVLALMEQLQADKARLEQELAQRLSSDQSRRLEKLEADVIDWDSDRAALQQRLSQQERQLSETRVSATRMRGLQKEKEMLEHTNALLHCRADELATKVKDLTERTEQQPIFPTCVEMDDNSALQTPTPRESLSLVGRDPSNQMRKADFPDLKALVSWVQARMASPSHRELGQDKKPLFYELRDLRLFLGGLAMSRLHLLEGISGTGKTSLPLAFARVLGAKSKVIPVQAGWRDRQDLLGHFNTFERRYLETAFLQALYEAQTPACKDRPYLIVLDEINLSRPEQYLADLISLLEQPEEARLLELLSQRIEPSPRGLIDGRFLPLPPNVWFVGTANHDETTLEIADKTYDRSHVMELPSKHPTFNLTAPTEFEPVGLEGLNRAFADAHRQHHSPVTKALAWLDTHLRKPLADDFRLAWSNRLKRQAERFIPVVMEAGGSLEEALDHLLARRILRRIQNRHDVKRGAYENLQRILDKEWKSLDSNSGGAEQTRLVLTREVKRLDFDRIEEEA